MDHPDEAAKYSRAGSGNFEDVPKTPISVFITDENNEPAGLLEKWSSEAWIYADDDSLQLLEPEPPDGDSY